MEASAKTMAMKPPIKRIAPTTRIALRTEEKFDVKKELKHLMFFILFVTHVKICN